MEFETKTAFWLLTFLVLESTFIFLVLYEPNNFNYKPLSIEQKTAMLDLNILCTANHNHPLLKEKEICVYIPNLKEEIKINGK